MAPLSAEKLTNFFVSKRTLSAGVVVVRGTKAPRYLLLRAYRNWDFPKGEVEPGESALAAACREVAEETSLKGLRFAWGEGYCETPPYAGGKVARYYLAEAPSGEVVLAVNPELGRPEHHEARWVDYDAAQRLLPSRLQPILDWARGRLEAGPDT